MRETASDVDEETLVSAVDTAGKVDMDVVVAKILTIIIITGLTVLAGLLPCRLLQHFGRGMLRRKREFDEVVSGAKCFAGGVFMGTCFLHLIPETRSKVDNVMEQLGSKSKYPLAELLTMVGFFGVIFGEHVIRFLYYKIEEDTCCPNFDYSDSYSFDHDYIPAVRDPDSDGCELIECRSLHSDSQRSYNNSNDDVNTMSHTTAEECINVPTININGLVPINQTISQSNHNSNMSPKHKSRSSEQRSRRNKDEPHSESSETEATCSRHRHEPHSEFTDNKANNHEPRSESESRHNTPIESRSEVENKQNETCNGTDAAANQIPCSNVNEERLEMELLSSIPLQELEVNTVVTEISKSEAAGKGRMRSVLLLAALSFHGVFEGLALGLQAKESDVWIMCIAIVIHRGILSFGMSLHYTRNNERASTIVFSISTFSIICVVGIVIGIAISTGAQLYSDVDVPNVILQSLATGTIFYIIFLNILFKELDGNRDVKKISCTFVGFAFMAVMFAVVKT